MLNLSPSFHGEMASYAYLDHRFIAKEIIKRCREDQTASAPPHLLEQFAMDKDWHTLSALVEKPGNRWRLPHGSIKRRYSSPAPGRDIKRRKSKKFAETGQRYQNLVEMETPLPMPDSDMQLDAACVLLQATARQPCTPEQWEAMRNAVRMLTEMDGLEDMVLTGFEPSGGFLTIEGLHKLLEDVQATLRLGQQGQAAASMEQL